jgi:hypothetical protein
VEVGVIVDGLARLRCATIAQRRNHRSVAATPSFAFDVTCNRGRPPPPRDRGLLLRPRRRRAPAMRRLTRLHSRTTVAVRTRPLWAASFSSWPFTAVHLLVAP